MPRIITKVRARADASYQLEYHYPLRSRIYSALNGTAFDDRHNAPQPPGFVTSSIMPFGDLSEGDERTLIIAAHERDLLQHVLGDFGRDRELNLGELPLTVDSAWIKDTDVGGPGSTGTITTRTGVLVEIPPSMFEGFGITEIVADTEQPEFWRPHLGRGPFDALVEANLALKDSLFGGDGAVPATDDTGTLLADGGGDGETPLDTDLGIDGPLFDSAEFLKDFAKPMMVTRSPDVRRTAVLSKHDFEFTVRNQRHRHLLNLALDCGLGSKNHLGMGFLDLTQSGTIGGG
jgi:CRISPR-associated endoribonuclease Cas6